MSLDQNEVAEQDANQEDSGAYEIGEEVRKVGKDAGRREDRRHGNGRSSKSTTNCRAYDRTDRPNEWHHRKRSCYGVSAKMM